MRPSVTAKIALWSAPLLFVAVPAVSPLMAAAQDAPGAPALTVAQQAIVTKARQFGATDIKVQPAPGGGFILGGKLEGDQFAVAFPANWNGKALLFAHGYSTPGSPIAVSENPIGKGTGAGGMLAAAYEDGLAAGHSAYDKAGMGVETATINTLRLRNFVVKLGARRVYVSGASMGGNIVLSLIEQHPRAFAGGLAVCGVTNGWESLFGQLVDMRVTYNYLTRGTPYALPGEQDATRSALPTTPPSGDTTNGEAYRWAQIGKIATPILALFRAAAADPNGPEARIARQVAAVGGFEVDAASVAFPLVTATLGADDLAATFGGQIIDNSKKTYVLPEMNAEELAAFNKGVQRIRADRGAVANARRWHQATGRFRVPLITMHNRIDSLVPYSQSEALGRIVRNARNDRLLVQYGVPATRAPLPVGGVEGYTHCGFTPEQGATAWRTLYNWVETGRRPSPDAVK
ncbi:alpha/beta hydrolase family protein [Sphingomonas canadensis]